MIPLLGRAETRAFDARAVAAGVPGLVLMENAGRGAADVVEREVLGGRAAGKRVVVLAGTGNNGGDGFVVARHLALRGACVEVAVVGDRARIAGDARGMLDAWTAVGGAVLPAGSDADGERLAGADAVIDALFGTGLDRDVDGPSAEAIRASCAAPRARRVALDVPSGLDADTGAARGEAFVAGTTVTFAHWKLGLATPGGAALAGNVYVADIGVPSARGASAHLLEHADVARLVSPRPAAAHKTTAGHVAVMAGSPGKLGAALLAAHGAFRAGAGLVTVATRTDAARDLDRRVLEVMTHALDPDDAGAVDAALAGKRAAVAGPGFGTDDVARGFVRRAIEVFDGPLVLDADALTVLARLPGAFAGARARLVLTPHPGEAARLLASSTTAIEADRFSAARALAASTRAVVVLKGAYSIVAAPDGRVCVSPFAVPALATAGAGDVLSGMTAALLATLDDAFDATCAAVYVHALAAERWSERHGDRGLLAHQIADGVPDLFAELLALREG